MPAWPQVEDPYNHQRIRDLEAEVERRREATIREVAAHLRERGEFACGGFEKEAAEFVEALLDA